jgi:hypothetical protein
MMTTRNGKRSWKVKKNAETLTRLRPTSARQEAEIECKC